MRRVFPLLTLTFFTIVVLTPLVIKSQTISIEKANLPIQAKKVTELEGLWVYRTTTNGTDVYGMAPFGNHFILVGWDWVSKKIVFLEYDQNGKLINNVSVAVDRDIRDNAVTYYQHNGATYITLAGSPSYYSETYKLYLFKYDGKNVTLVDTVTIPFLYNDFFRYALMIRTGKLERNNQSLFVFMSDYTVNNTWKTRILVCTTNPLYCIENITVDENHALVDVAETKDYIYIAVQHRDLGRARIYIYDKNTGELTNILDTPIQNPTYDPYVIIGKNYETNCIVAAPGYNDIYLVCENGIIQLPWMIPPEVAIVHKNNTIIGWIENRVGHDEEVYLAILNCTKHGCTEVSKKKLFTYVSEGWYVNNTDFNCWVNAKPSYLKPMGTTAPYYVLVMQPFCIDYKYQNGTWTDHIITQIRLVPIKVENDKVLWDDKLIESYDYTYGGSYQSWTYISYSLFGDAYPYYFIIKHYNNTANKIYSKVWVYRLETIQLQPPSPPPTTGGAPAVEEKPKPKVQQNITPTTNVTYPGVQTVVPGLRPYLFLVGVVALVLLIAYFFWYKRHTR